MLFGISIILILVGIFLRIKCDRINLCMTYIANHTKENGKFVYATNINTNAYIPEKYNVVRHAGTLYSMYLCERIEKNNRLYNKRLLASDYFINNFVHSYNKDICMIYDTKNKASLGGAGLALVGLSNLHTKSPKYANMLEHIGNFIIYMQKPDGSFYHSFDLNKNEKDEMAYCLYYTGEAALGLLYLNEFSPNKKWVYAAKKALLYKSKTKEYTPFDHWTLIASKKLFETPDNTLTDKEIAELKEFAINSAKDIIKLQIGDKHNPYCGALQNNWRPCSIATVMEGLIAAYSYIDDSELKQQIKIAIDLGLNFLSKYQIKYGKLAGGIPANAIWKNVDNESYSMIRIDFVQHVLSAFITYKEMN